MHVDSQMSSHASYGDEEEVVKSKSLQKEPSKKEVERPKTEEKEVIKPPSVKPESVKEEDIFQIEESQEGLLDTNMKKDIEPDLDELTKTIKKEDSPELIGSDQESITGDPEPCEMVILPSADGKSSQKGLIAPADHEKKETVEVSMPLQVADHSSKDLHAPEEHQTDEMAFHPPPIEDVEQADLPRVEKKSTVKVEVFKSHSSKKIVTNHYHNFPQK